MAYEEYSCETFHSECVCGKGFLRYTKKYVYNDWGHTQVIDTPIEIICEYCKANYHYEEVDFSTYLVPNGLSIPQNPPKSISSFLPNIEEKTIGRCPKSELDNMLTDMTAPKHRYIKNLQNKNAIWFAQEIWKLSNKRALSPMISLLREIIENYDAIYESYEIKQKIKEKYMQEVAEYKEKYREVESLSKKLSFERHSIQHSQKHKAAMDFWKRYALSHPEEDMADLELDLTFEKDFTNFFWDSYKIIECSDSEYIARTPNWSPHKNKLTKKYLCICSICGQSAEYVATDFCIKKDFDQAYFPVPCCSCHTVSSFESKAMDILNHHGISYIREKTFNDLVGNSGKLLRFDFALFKNHSDEGSPIIDLVIELQGPHHYEKGYYDEDGDYITEAPNIKTQKDANSKYERQIRYDQLKHAYCLTHGIKIEYIKYTNSDYARLESKIVSILKQNNYDFLPENRSR